jgi:quinol monooxygenase YgiN
MFGTIMRARVKPGQRDAFLEQMRSRGNAGRNPGFIAAELAFEDKDPDRVLAVIHFRDRDSYMANAQRPEVDSEYRAMVDYLVEPPEWIDVHYTHYTGEPLSEQTAGSAAR